MNRINYKTYRDKLQYLFLYRVCNNFKDLMSKITRLNNFNNYLMICTIKMDIYSLGVILTELFHLFKTESERYITLNNLKKGIIPNYNLVFESKSSHKVISNFIDIVRENL